MNRPASVPKAPTIANQQCGAALFLCRIGQAPCNEPSKRHDLPCLPWLPQNEVAKSRGQIKCRVDDPAGRYYNQRLFGVKLFLIQYTLMR
jgi:hypothetical protein